jgi:hypothetical protein
VFPLAGLITRRYAVGKGLAADQVHGRGRLCLPRSVISPSDASERIRAHRWGAKLGLATVLLLIGLPALR